MENKYIYEKIDKVLENQDKVDYEELLELFKMLELNIQTSEANTNNNKLDESSFYTYIPSSYYVNKLETIYSSFVVTTSRNEDER